MDQQEKSARQRNVFNQVRELSAGAEKLVREVVDQYAAQLDEFVSKVEAELEERKEFNDKTLNSLVLRLPILMYRMSDAIDRSAIESDIAKALVKNVRARHYQSASGTIPDKEAAAELATQDESAVVDLTRHVYNRLKGKMERADALFDGVRKVITARTTEKTVFGKDKQR